MNLNKAFFSALCLVFLLGFLPAAGTSKPVSAFSESTYFTSTDSQKEIHPEPDGFTSPKESSEASLDTSSLYELLDTAQEVAGGAEDPYRQEIEPPRTEAGTQSSTEEFGKGSQEDPEDPSWENYVTPGAASFTVHKASETKTAAPGDTVYYTITIRNTGAVILHSVVSTEKFRLTGINARFLPQEGIRLSPDQTQALIGQIRPQESVTLRASVVIPENLTDQSLINQVVVTSTETGTTPVTSDSEVMIRPTSNTLSGSSQGTSSSGSAAGTRQSSSGSSGSYGSYSSSGNSTAQTLSPGYTASDPPKTGDASKVEILLCALGAAAAVIILSLILKIRRRRKTEDQPS